MWWQEPQQYFWILRPNHAEEGAWSFLIVQLPTSLWCLHRLLNEREIATVIWGSLCGRSGTYLLLRSPHLRDEKEHVHEEHRGRVLQEEETSQAAPVKSKENQMVPKGKAARRGWCEVKQAGDSRACVALPWNRCLSLAHWTSQVLSFYLCEVGLAGTLPFSWDCCQEQMIC